MKSRLIKFVVSIAALLMVCSPSFAHHGTMFGYDQTKELTLKGVVTEFIWANPHVGVLFDVADAKGKVTHWGGEDGAPHVLTLLGWSKDVLKPGDKITVVGHPAKTGKPYVMDEEIVLADGRVLKRARLYFLWQICYRSALSQQCSRRA